MDRFRRRAKGGRFGERLVTLTLPHVGNAGERITTIKRVWPRFWRLLSDEMRPRLASLASGIEHEKGGAFSLWDLVQYLWVLEWTPGADGLGHPHLHVWLFSPFIERALIESLWREAYCDVTGAKVERLIVDVRAAWEVEREGKTVGSEIVKYLLKDWEIDDRGVRRAQPEIFAQVYAAVDGSRQRQSSAGLAVWRIAKFTACPCCGFQSERGHWASIRIAHAMHEAKPPPSMPWTPPEVSRGPPAGPESTEQRMSREYWERRDREWAESLELRIVKARFRAHFPPEGE